MSALAWFFVCALGLGLSCRGLLRGAPRAAQQEQSRLARLVDRPVPTPGSAIDERFVTRRRGQILGWTAGALPFIVAQGAALLLNLDASQVGTIMILPVGMAIGSSLGAAVDHRRLAGRRHASLVRRDLTGIVTPIEVASTWAALLVPSAGIITGAWLWRTGADTRYALVAAGGSMLALLAWTATAALIRRVVRTAIPAASSDDLAWNEILRALTVRDLVLAQVVGAAALAAVPATFALGATARPYRELTLFAVAAAPVLACSLAGLVDRRLRWMRTHAGREALA